MEENKTVVDTGGTDVTKTIEAKSQKPAVSKKRIVLIILFSIISIVVVILTIKFYLQIDWSKLFSSISNGFAYKIGILWFFLLIFYFVFVNFNNFSIVWIRLRKLGYKIPALEYWLLGFITSFFRSVTPTFLGDSFAVIWLKSNGVPLYRVTSMLFTNTFLWQVVQYLVTFPSFVMVLIFRGPLLSTSEGITAFVFLCLGIIIDTFSVIFMYLMCVSRKVHYFLSKIFNWFKKKLHMKYHTKEEIALKYKEKAVIKQEFYAYMKDIKTTGIVLGLLVLGELLTYFSIGWSMYFVQYVHMANEGTTQIYKVNFDFWWAFNSANVTFTANRLNFLIPNGEGSLEFMIRTFLTCYANFSAEPYVDMGSEMGQALIKQVTDNSILVWRAFGAFLPSFFGIAALIWWVIAKVKKTQKGGKMFEEEKPLEELKPVVQQQPQVQEKAVQ